MMTRAFSISFTALILILTMISCTDSPSVPSNYPPALPLESSMGIHFSNFGKQKSSVKSQQLSFNNFARAAFTAGVMKAVIEANLFIPRALLDAASDSEAKINEKDRWEWNYRAFVDGKSYEVRLVALPGENNSTKWKFYVTNIEQGLDGRLLFSGTTSANGRQGSWSYFSLQNTSSSEAISKIKWSLNSKDELHIRVDVISNRFERGGDYIDYTFNGTTKSTVYYDAGEDKTTEIQWNIKTNIGYIFSLHYNNGRQACWDENFADIACNEL
ncbi:MAG TPA: hypothetical protein VFG39_01750 [Balneolaceae bacterium]|nr:hypothetical protein [Balneolaceae bacterium]